VEQHVYQWIVTWIYNVICQGERQLFALLILVEFVDHHCLNFLFIMYVVNLALSKLLKGPEWLNELGSWIT
jgi:hypothetical protein